MNKNIGFQTISFFILLGLMLVLVGKLFLPYATVLFWSAILYILISPLYNKIIAKMNPEKKWFNLTRRFLAGTFAVGTVVIVAAVLLFIVIKLVGQGKALFQRISLFLIDHNELFFNFDKEALNELVIKLSMGTLDISAIDIKKEVMNFLSQYSSNLLGYTRTLFANMGLFAVSLVFTCFTLYFFYIDGHYLLNLFISIMPIKADASTKLLNKFNEVTTNLLKGLFLVSFYQCIISLIIYLIFKVEGALLLAILTFFSSFLPLVGCAFVWFPIGIGICLLEGWLKGIIFLLVAGTLISFMDNFLRPFFLKDRIKIHPLLIFFSMLGGVQMLGFNGIILGPMIVILFFTIIDIAHDSEKEYASVFNE
ncbi:AI-2E family transporter [Treponema phagedenis]|uniref:AI-2E family transporter n=1 Tax=Treponema phagedenis TaxID=162 RepID=A0A0B7GY90_TREPH|nr:AI-2E family transporter [Treponema phagedenis]EFW38872.1 hypothetical protein HMPREF9554_00591 [Treponema phagedenis F0421]NVP23919.1 AI-2E family transporter [Treponema phagedenis]QEJ93832.1 AI-2E family transporter [Treponema phagedenis]QEJ96590.1 AI-2E family transporter [Treponema phagedenis]QEJ99757.1 AI-2E family transporter [Treponema phagedenis]